MHVFLYVCVYVYGCMFVCVCSCAYVCMDTCAHTHTPHVHMCIHMCMHAYTSHTRFANKHTCACIHRASINARSYQDVCGERVYMTRARGVLADPRQQLGGCGLRRRRRSGRRRRRGADLLWMQNAHRCHVHSITPEVPMKRSDRY